jgi:hypothetical protein
MPVIEPKNIRGGGRIELIVFEPVVTWHVPTLSLNEYAMPQTVMRDPCFTVEVC